MDGVGLRPLRDAHDLGDGEIRLDRAERALQMRAAADLIRLVGLETVQRKLVLFGEEADRFQPEFVCGAENPDGDLRPVGDQKLADSRQPSPPGTKSSHLKGAMLQCNRTVRFCGQGERALMSRVTHRGGGGSMASAPYGFAAIVCLRACWRAKDCRHART